jgi:hypothetical protein
MEIGQPISAVNKVMEAKGHVKRTLKTPLRVERKGN